MSEHPDPWWLPAEGMPDGVRAGASARLQGASRGPWQRCNLARHVGDDPAAVELNRNALQRHLQADAVQWLNQVHGVKVIQADAASTEDAPEADAAWTSTPGVALAIMTADCVPVLFAERAGCVVGAAHAGWQGLRDGVLAQLLAAMPVRAADLTAWIGPCICPRCYEVDADVWQAFSTSHAAALAPHPSVADKRLLDLGAVAQQQLRDAGVTTVQMSGWCSYEDPRFYSHRQAQHAGLPGTGRMASVVMLRKPDA